MGVLHATYKHFVNPPCNYFLYTACMSPLERLLQAADQQGLTKPAQVCARLEISPQTWFNWRDRNHLPEKNWVQVAEKMRLTLDYLILGRGEPDVGDTLTERERMAVDALRCMLDEQQDRAVKELVRLAEENLRIAEELNRKRPTLDRTIRASSAPVVTPPSKTPASSASAKPARKGARR
jgi:hypothetical protein